MSSPLNEILQPLAGEHRRAAVNIHAYLRELILTNALPPDTVLSQVEVASCLKVSRTPVREALRKLQEEGLVAAEPNYRCRVLGFNPGELEALYVSRITNEGSAAAITVGRMADADIARLRDTLEEMDGLDEQKHLGRWISAHRRFHQLLFAQASEAIRRRMTLDCEWSERYLYKAMQSGRIDLFRAAAIEHRQLYEACRQRQSMKVVSLLTSHLARSAIGIISELAPYWEPAVLRAATRLMLAGTGHCDDTGAKAASQAE